MPTYRVFATTAASSSFLVEADSPEEAKKKFEQEGSDDMPSLCHQCASQSRGGTVGELTIGDEWDAGEVQKEED